MTTTLQPIGGAPLSRHEYHALGQHERTIERGLSAFAEVGMALCTIRDGRLYREAHGTFGDYCRNRWSFGASRARQLIGAAKTVRNLESVTVVTPANEAQARELAGLEPEQQREAWTLAVAELPVGRITAAHVAEVVKRMAPKDRRMVVEAARMGNARQALSSSESSEWYTPAKYIEAARELMGAIDLDPASCEQANQTVCAERYYSAADDGLAQQWRGRVWLNPPYGRDSTGESSQGVWSQHLAEEYEAGRVSEGVLLVNAVTGCRWFAPLWRRPICFVYGRIGFTRPSGVALSPIHGNVLVYFGTQVARFVEMFSGLGRCVLPRCLGCGASAASEAAS